MKYDVEWYVATAKTKRTKRSSFMLPDSFAIPAVCQIVPRSRVRSFAILVRKIIGVARARVSRKYRSEKQQVRRNCSPEGVFARAKSDVRPKPMDVACVLLPPFFLRIYSRKIAYPKRDIYIYMYVLVLRKPRKLLFYRCEPSLYTEYRTGASRGLYT